MPIPYPRIPPDVVRIGPFHLRWYGIMYFVGYAVGIALARRRIAAGRSLLSREQVDRLIAYAVIGMLIGARVVYMIAYSRMDPRRDPLEALRVWHGGLSFLWLPTVDLAVARVQERSRRGGHSVPEETVRRRYGADRPSARGR
jgi:prolipoprotein diacylglyceryltransferase